MMDCHGFISRTSLSYTDGQRLLSNTGQDRKIIIR